MSHWCPCFSNCCSWSSGSQVLGFTTISPSDDFSFILGCDGSSSLTFPSSLPSVWHLSQTQPNPIFTGEKMLYLKTSSSIGLSCYKRRETRLCPCRPQPIRPTLPFKIIYINIVALWLHWHSMILKPAQ